MLIMRSTSSSSQSAKACRPTRGPCEIIRWRRVGWHLSACAGPFGPAHNEIFMAVFARSLRSRPTSRLIYFNAPAFTDQFASQLSSGAVCNLFLGKETHQQRRKCADNGRPAGLGNRCTDEVMACHLVHQVSFIV
jgi:hypothetical protein